MNLKNKDLSRYMTRIGLGLFFLVFGVLKFTAGTWFINGPYKGFYGATFPLGLLYFIGAIQVAVGLAFFAGRYTKAAGWIGSGMMLSTIIATLPKILATFQLPPSAAPPGFLFFAAVPLLFMTLSEALRKETSGVASSKPSSAAED